MITIEDQFELLALHRCIFEAKFNATPNDKDIAGSPIVAKLANDIVSQLEKTEGSNWDSWRVAEKHQDRIKDLISSLKASNLEHCDTQESKTNFVIAALAPLVATKDTIENIVKEVFLKD